MARAAQRADKPAFATSRAAGVMKRSCLQEAARRATQEPAPASRADDCRSPIDFCCSSQCGLPVHADA